MIYYNTKKYSVLLSDQQIQQAEKKFHMKFLYGAFVGSQVYEAIHGTSDYDLSLTFNSNQTNSALIHLSDPPSTVDVYAYALEKVHKNNIAYFQKGISFPTFYTKFRKSPEEDRHIGVFRIFCSDYIWDSGYLRQNLSKEIQHVEPLLIIDFLFNRSAGNLENSLRLDTVPVKRIIQAIYNINCIFWILKYHTFPYLNFTEMVKLFHNEEMNYQILDILHFYQNWASGSAPATLPRNDALNRYIEGCLQRIETAVHDIDRDTFKLSLDANSFLGKLVTSGQFGHQECNLL